LVKIDSQLPKFCTETRDMVQQPEHTMQFFVSWHVHGDCEKLHSVNTCPDCTRAEIKEKKSSPANPHTAFFVRNQSTYRLGPAVCVRHRLAGVPDISPIQHIPAKVKNKLPGCTHRQSQQGAQTFVPIGYKRSKWRKWSCFPSQPCFAK
jgi:hypothetical protein